MRTVRPPPACPRRHRRPIALLALVVAVPAADAGNRPAPPKPTIVLVHGAFADASSWNPVVTRLQRTRLSRPRPGQPAARTEQRQPVPGQRPRHDRRAGRSSSATRTAARSSPTPRPGNANVKALVYVAAFALDQGESLASISTQFPNSDLGASILPRPSPGGTDLYIRPDVFRSVFAADLPRATTDVMAATQRPLADLGFGEPSGAPAWATIPSWYMVAANDRAIDPAAERFMAQRAHAHTTVERSSHVAMLSHPDDVARMIVDAARTTG